MSVDESGSAGFCFLFFAWTLFEGEKHHVKLMCQLQTVYGIDIFCLKLPCGCSKSNSKDGSQSMETGGVFFGIVYDISEKEQNTKQ